jgi:vacuolar-type H+-ATPase subunit C/Vma6
VNARARGLGTHLHGRAELEALTRAPDLPALAAELARRGYLVSEAGAEPASLDLAVRRWAAEELRTLARWTSRRPELGVVLFEDEDRRSLRALTRGASQGTGTELRLAGLIPTPSLPERALGELARQPSTAALAALLVAWRHPYGPALRADPAAAGPDLLRLEMELSRTFAARALAAAVKGGRRLLAYVREVIDLENAYAALVLGGHRADVVPKDLFLAGGARLSITGFELAVDAPSPALAGQRIAQAFTGLRVARPFEQYGEDPGRLEREVLRARIAALHAEERFDPLGPAPVLAYALRLRAQVVDLRRVIWGIALGAPHGGLAAGLVGA